MSSKGLQYNLLVHYIGMYHQNHDIKHSMYRILMRLYAIQVKEEGWWLVLGDVKRISFKDLTTTRLTFPVSNGAGRPMSEVTLFFVSDSYQGLDQQYIVPVAGHKTAQREPRHKAKQQHGGTDARDAAVVDSRKAVEASAQRDDAGSDGQ